MEILKKHFKQSAFLLCTGLTLQASSSFAARCDYVVQSEWGTGFVAAIRITNDTNTPINGWAVNWAYTDGSTRTGGWNANFSGSNPYRASGVGWNDRINPGQSVEFGVQGNKGVANKPAQRPVISGAVCSGIASSVQASSLASRTSSSVVQSSSSLPGSSSSLPPSSSSSRTSSSSPTSTSHVSWSSSSKPQSSSSSSFSSGPNSAPVANLQLTAHGLTLQASGHDSVDADGHTLQYSIDFGDGQTIRYPEAWHTYEQAGEYNVILTVSDGISQSTQAQVINVQAAGVNKAPIARLSISLHSGGLAYGSSSYDYEGVPLVYEWDIGDGSFIDDGGVSIGDCPNNAGLSRLITLTVSDGELKDTIQGRHTATCQTPVDNLPIPLYSYLVEGNTLFVDARDSYRDIGFLWDFGDGTTATGLLATHTYAAPGTYDVNLYVRGQDMFGASITKQVVIGGNNSSVSSSSSFSSAPAPTSSSSKAFSSQINSSFINSSVSSTVASSQASSDRNLYNAARATTAPVIDGTVDAVWSRASWSAIDVFWLGTQPNPTAQDYSGRYKALWDEDYLYLLVDVTDDRIYDGVRDALDRYWEDDTVELFIDENKNGGQHSYNTSAWAYHVSTYGDVVDYTTSGPKLLNEHIDARLVSNGAQHFWELRVRIFGEDYADWKANTPLKLFSGKLLGFSASYIDNDGSQQRESMMGSVDTQGHKNNQGYLDASVFGSLRLVE